MALWVFVALAFLTPVMLYALKGVHLENDVEAWLPEDDPEARVLAWSAEHFPSGDRILVSWEGSTLDDPRIARFEDELLGTTDDDGIVRGGIPYVGSVLTPNDLLQRMIDQEVPADEAARRLEGVLIGTGRIKIELTEAGRASQEKTIARDCLNWRRPISVSKSQLTIPFRSSRTRNCWTSLRLIRLNSTRRSRNWPPSPSMTCR